MTDLYQRIADRARELEPEIARMLADLVRVPSFTGQEGEVIQVAAKMMAAIGFDDIRIDGLGNLIGRMGGGPRTLAFDAHLDVVRPGDPGLWRDDPFTPRIEGGQIWGRGTADQKGGFAAMLGAATIIKELGLNREFSLYFTGTVMEEDCDGLCWKYLVEEERLQPEMVVLTEPSGLKLARGQRGRMDIQVRVQGRSCHGSAPERGDNAIYKISRVALELEKLHARLKEGPVLGKGSLCVSQVFFTGPSQCAVPDSAWVNLDRRLTLGETRESALAEVREACTLVCCPEAEVTVPEYREPAYTGRVYPMDRFFPAWIMPEDDPMLAEAVQAYQAVLGREPEVFTWAFSTNGTTAAGLAGIPCIGLGPGDEALAHTPNEHCPLEHLSAAAGFYAALVARLNLLG
jgi:putative selenium metabolism hydrolase